MTTAVEGWPVEIADTAGLRRTDDPIELQGLELARERASRADLVLLLLDRSEPLRADDLDALDALPEALRVASKADLPPRWEAGELGALPLSAETSIGLDDLLAAIGRRLVPAPPEPGAGVPFRREHIQAIETIRESLLAGRIEEAKACLAAIVPGLPSGAGD